MENQFKIPDSETRARTLAKLKEARYQGDLAILMLDEAIALADAHLLKQRRERLLYKSDRLHTESIEI
jgi:hypothetical protein